jgi:hypothetical protein
VERDEFVVLVWTVEMDRALFVASWNWFCFEFFENGEFLIARKIFFTSLGQFFVYDVKIALFHPDNFS